MQRAWQVVVHEMESKPHADPMLVRLVLMFLSFEKCPKKKISLTLKGKKEEVSSSDARRKALMEAFAGALHLRDCRKSVEEQNCQTLTSFLQLRKTLQLHFEPLDEDHPPDAHTQFFAGGELEAVTPSEAEALREELEEDMRADTAFGKLAAGEHVRLLALQCAVCRPTF